MFSCLLIAALWSPAGKDWPLGSLVCDVLLCFVTIPYGVLGQVRCLIVSIPVICLLSYSSFQKCTVKPVLSGHSQKHQKWVFKTNYCLMQVKSIAECSPWIILQYFRPTLGLPHGFKTFVLFIFELSLKTSFTELFDSILVTNCVSIMPCYNFPTDPCK